MAKYEKLNVTSSLLWQVVGNLWPRGHAELLMTGQTVPDLAAKLYAQALAGKSFILTADGKPVLATGICRTKDDAFTWFAATSDFDAHAIAITRTLRQQLKEHGDGVAIYSVLPHPDAERWFRVLGFRRAVGWSGRTRAGFPLYKFVRS